MLAHLNEVIGSGIRKQVNPFLGVKRLGSEVLEEVVVNNVRTIPLKMELVSAISCIRSIVQMPPIPTIVSNAWK